MTQKKLQSQRPEKRSLTLNRHRTSVSLEYEFWVLFSDLAKSQKESINSLATKIDTARDPNTSLASAIRIFCLRETKKYSGTS